MLKKSLRNIALGCLLLPTTTLAIAAMADPTTPSDMTCKEFLDLNPKSMTPVVFWMLNDDTQYKGGDYVDLHETGSIVTPKVVEACQQTPDKKLTEMKDDIAAFAKKHS